MKPIGINRVPLATPGTEQPPNTTEVQAGETTLRQVAQRLMLLETQLLALNPQLPNPHSLNPGQLLRVPAPSGSTSARPSTPLAAPAPDVQGGFASLKAAFRKTDLGDPDEAERAVAAALDQLLGDSAVANRLGEAGRGRIAAVMKNDPVIRGRILGQLKKVLD